MKNKSTGILHFLLFKPQTNIKRVFKVDNLHFKIEISSVKSLS